MNVKVYTKNKANPFQYFNVKRTKLHETPSNDFVIILINPSDIYKKERCVMFNASEILLVEEIYDECDEKPSENATFTSSETDE